MEIDIAELAAVGHIVAGVGQDLVGLRPVAQGSGSAMVDGRLADLVQAHGCARLARRADLEALADGLALTAARWAAAEAELAALPAGPR